MAVTGDCYHGEMARWRSSVANAGRNDEGGGWPPWPQVSTFELAGDAQPIAGPLEDGEVAVWTAHQDAWATEARRARWETLAGEDERERAAHFHFDADRHTFLAAHGLLRIALAQHGGAEPRSWRFAASPGGRPEIVPPSRLRFSLSHTRDLVMCALSLDREVGIDAEDSSRGAPLELARSYFSPREVEDLEALPAEQRPARFFEYWTLKESYVKARGLGLSVPLDRFWFVRDGHGSWRIEIDPALGDRPGRWSFRSWRIGERHQAALAVAADAAAVAPPAHR